MTYDKDDISGSTPVPHFFFNFSGFLSTDRLWVKSILEIEIVSGDEAVQDDFADLNKGLGSFSLTQNCL